MLLNQPLAAIHAANDEEHLSHVAVHTAYLPAAAHDNDGQHHGNHKNGDPAHPDNLHHQTCQVCPLFGSALPIPVQAKITHASAWHHSAGPAAIQATKTEKRLRVGDPVRAPPPDHLI
jgi:hypothetical protein